MTKCGFCHRGVAGEKHLVVRTLRICLGCFGRFCGLTIT